MLKSLVATSALLVAAATAPAAVVVSDGFEYADQAAFEAVWTPIASGTPSSVILSTAQANGGTKSAFVPATGTTNNLYRNRLTFAETGTISPLSGSVTFSFDIYDGAPTGAPNRNYINLQDTTAPTGTNQLVAMGFNNNQTGANSGGQYYMARILGYSPATVDPDGGPNETGTLGGGAFFKLNDFPVSTDPSAPPASPLRSLGWHNLKVVITSDDGLSADYAFYVDNILAERVNNVGTAASAFRSFDNIALSSGVSNGSQEAYYDNVLLDVVIPEPSFAALALPVLALLARRRK